MLSIRHASVPDIPLIRDLAFNIWPATYTSIIGPAQVSYMLDLFYSPQALQKQMDAGQQFIICSDDTHNIGFASWGEVSPGIYKLHKLYVLPELQGKGAGRQMMEYSVTELKEKKALAIRLNVNRYNLGAIGFYEKLGFTKLYDEDIDIGDGFFMNDHVLSRDL